MNRDEGAKLRSHKHIEIKKCALDIYIQEPIFIIYNDIEQNGWIIKRERLNLETRLVDKSRQYSILPRC